MAQTFNTKFILGKPNRIKECLVYLRFYSKAGRILIPTPVRVLSSQFDPLKSGRNPIQKHPNAKSLNNILDNFRIDIEAKAIMPGAIFSLEYFLGKSSSNETIYSFIDDFKKKMIGKMSDGRIRHYTVVQNKINDFQLNVTFKDISLDWLQRFEQHIRKKLSPNTVHSNMTILKSILNRAEELGLIEKKQYEKYIPPPYIEDIPVYIDESQIEAFHKVVKSLGDEVMQIVGYYFLLSCYAGYRISDLYAFNYDEKVRNNIIILRAKKNGSIVSIPVYKKLKEILNYCKEHKITISEKDFRVKLKSIAKMAGIKYDISPHSGRHSFAMLMLEKGLTVDEVAELLGDSKDVAKVYARILNKQLHRRVLEVMK